jgi:hypothetical protein
MQDSDFTITERIERGTQMGFSPRTSERVQRTLVLPIPDTVISRKYIAWSPENLNFEFRLMPVEQWMEETGASLRMHSQAFEVHGRPLLLWRVCYSVAPKD